MAQESDLLFLLKAVVYGVFIAIILTLEICKMAKKLPLMN